MFTGIVTEVGRIERAVSRGAGKEISVRAAASARDLSVHDSVAVDGVCLTVIRCDGDVFSVEAVEETLRKTTTGVLAAGSRVNLELALRAGDRLGGHMVQGHVDCVGVIRSLDQRANSRLYVLEFPPEFVKYVVRVGSIAADGVSLTVAEVSANRCTISIIPYTLDHTTLADWKVGTEVNLEFDLIGKYIEKLVEAGPGGGGLSEERLREWGYGV